MSEAATVIEIKEEGDIVLARRAGRDLARSLGFRTVDQSRIATAISELTRNILQYAQRGEVIVQPAKENRGIEIIARDKGPGIRNVEEALRDGFTSGVGLGIGLPGTRRLVDEMEVTSKAGSGTTVVIRKWLR